jgi:hypothetical protein
MRHNLAILLLGAVIHFAIVAAIVIPFGSGTMSWMLELAIIAVSVAIAVVTVRLGQENE